MLKKHPQHKVKRSSTQKYFYPFQVVRVKNRYDNARGAAAGGYRDLSLNLRVTSVEAQELGVDGHVCEVQLILQSFHELKVK